MERMCVWSRRAFPPRRREILLFSCEERVRKLNYRGTNADMMMEMEMEILRERKGSSRGLWLLRQSFSVCWESLGSVCLIMRVRDPLYRLLGQRGGVKNSEKLRYEFASFRPYKIKKKKKFVFFFWSRAARIPMRESEFFLWKSSTLFLRE